MYQCNTNAAKKLKTVTFKKNDICFYILKRVNLIKIINNLFKDTNRVLFLYIKLQRHNLLFSIIHKC